MGNMSQVKEKDKLKWSLSSTSASVFVHDILLHSFILEIF